MNMHNSWHACMPQAVCTTWSWRSILNKLAFLKMKNKKKYYFSQKKYLQDTLVLIPIYSFLLHNNITKMGSHFAHVDANSSPALTCPCRTRSGRESCHPRGRPACVWAARAGASPRHTAAAVSSPPPGTDCSSCQTEQHTHGSHTRCLQS